MTLLLEVSWVHDTTCAICAKRPSATLPSPLDVPPLHAAAMADARARQAMLTKPAGSLGFPLIASRLLPKKTKSAPPRASRPMRSVTTPARRSKLHPRSIGSTSRDHLASPGKARTARKASRSNPRLTATRTPPASTTIGLSTGPGAESSRTTRAIRTSPTAASSPNRLDQ